MRKIDKIIIHCTATPEGRAVTMEEVRRWHVKGNGWADIGYHYLIDINGCVNYGRGINIIGSHTYGFNTGSIGLAYVGGTDAEGLAKDTLTNAQRYATQDLIDALRLVIGPELSVHGHNEFSKKSCPSFDVKDKFK